MEIERKFLIKHLPSDIESAEKHKIEQGYLCTEPVVRIRREDDDYYMTYKSQGLMSREEYNLPLNAAAYEQLRAKVDGNIITKTRHRIPYGDHLVIELDFFRGVFAGVMLAEVEFSSEAEANHFTPPEWFGEDVTYTKKYHNSTMSQADPKEYM